MTHSHHLGVRIDVKVVYFTGTSGDEDVLAHLLNIDEVWQSIWEQAGAHLGRI